MPSQEPRVSIHGVFEQGSGGDGGMKNPASGRKARDDAVEALTRRGGSGDLPRPQPAPNISQGIVDQSMALGQVMDDATQGLVPDDLVMSFMLDITQEVVDIANASGIQVQPADMAQAVQEVLAQTIEAFGGDASPGAAGDGQHGPGPGGPGRRLGWQWLACFACGVLGGIGGYADGAAQMESHEQRMREQAQMRMDQERLRQQDRLELLAARQSGSGAAAVMAT